MTCHAIEFAFSDEFSSTKAETMIDDVLGRFVLAVRDQEHPEDPNTVSERVTESGTPYYFGLYRFSHDEDSTAILDAIQQKLDANSADWYRIRFHECYNDGEQTGYCEWDESKTREHGTVPSDL